MADRDSPDEDSHLRKTRDEPLSDSPDNAHAAGGEGAANGEETDPAGEDIGVAYFGDGGLTLNGGGSVLEILSSLSSHEDDEEEVEDAFNTLAGRCGCCARLAFGLPKEYQNEPRSLHRSDAASSTASIVPIVKALSAHAMHAGIVESACRALARVATTPKNQGAFSRAGGVVPLVAALNRHVASSAAGAWTWH